MISLTEKDKRQELFDALRVSCNFGNADMKNEHFEMFFDPMDHTTIDIPDDPTDEEPSVRHAHEAQPMDVSEDNVNAPKLSLADMMAEDESLFTTGISDEDEESQVAPSSQYTLNDCIDISDDEVEEL